MKCIRAGCQEEAKGRGLCVSHHWQWYSRGSDPTQALPSRRHSHKSKGDPAKRRRAVEAYRDGDAPVPEVAARFGITDRSLHRWVKQAGVQKRFNWEPWTPDEVARVVELGRAGCSIREVSRKMRRQNHQKIGDIFRGHGIPIWNGRHAQRRAA